MTLGNDHMAFFKTLASTISCASLVFILPGLAAANQDAETVKATHFISSGRVVNVVMDVTPDAQAKARAAIWALTQQPEAGTCEKTGSANASCFSTFHAGGN